MSIEKPRKVDDDAITYHCEKCDTEVLLNTKAMDQRLEIFNIKKERDELKEYIKDMSKSGISLLLHEAKIRSLDIESRKDKEEIRVLRAEMFNDATDNRYYQSVLDKVSNALKAIK